MNKSDKYHIFVYLLNEYNVQEYTSATYCNHLY